MSQFGSKVVAVIDTQSAFGSTIKQMKENVDTLSGQMSALLADAPETLDTLNEIAAAISDDPAFFTTMATANAALQNNIDALTTAAANARTALQAALQTNIDGVATDLTTESTARGVAIANLDTIITALQSEVDGNETTSAAARTALSNRIDTLEADPTTATAVAAVQADVDANETATNTALADKLGLGGGTLTGSLAIAKSFPDVELKAGNEKRILFSDAGGGSTAAIKHVSTTLDFFAGGIAAGNKEMSIGTDGVDVSALKIDGTAVSATAAEINAFDGRLDILEADPTTKAYVDTQVTNLVDAAPGALDTLNELAAALGDDANFATTITNSIAAVQADVDANETASDAAEAALSGRLDTLEADPTTAAAVATVQADVDANEAASDAAEAALSGRLDTLEADPTTATAVAAVQADVDQNETDADAAIAAVQADVDQNESDADTAIALKADKAGDTFTGDITLRKSDGSAVALVLSRQDHADMSCVWKIQPSYVSADKECLSVLAAGQPVAHFDERQRVSINKTDPDYTLDVSGDGKFSTDLTIGGTLTLGGTAITATATELNYCDGVTSNIQAQLDAAGGVSADDTTLTGLTTMESAKFSTVLPEYTNDTNAAAGGVPVGGLYRTMQLVKIRIS